MRLVHESEEELRAAAHERSVVHALSQDNAAAEDVLSCGFDGVVPLLEVDENDSADEEEWSVDMDGDTDSEGDCFQ